VDKDSDAPDRIWITKEIRPYKVKKPKLLPEVENFEYAYVPKLVEKVEAMEIQGNRVQVILDVIEIIKGDGCD